MDALWANLKVIDCFATDHAPHTLEEKEGPKPPPGFPGLETALPLLLTAVADKRLTLDDLVLRMVTNPRKIFSLPEQVNAWIEVDPAAEWEISARNLYSRCGWTPFEGWKVRGRVRRVVLRGQDVFRDGQVIANPGYGIRRSRNINFKLRTHKGVTYVEYQSRQPQRQPPPALRRSTHCSLVREGTFFRSNSSAVADLEYIFGVAHEMREMVARVGTFDLLKGKILANLFYEPSTRTSSSFTSAMERLEAV